MASGWVLIPPPVGLDGGGFQRAGYVTAAIFEWSVCQAYLH
jgi:hypothetical protein